MPHSTIIIIIKAICNAQDPLKKAANKSLMKFVLAAHNRFTEYLFETPYKFCDIVKRYVALA